MNFRLPWSVQQLPDLDKFSSERWNTVKKSIETFPSFPSQTRPLPPFLSVNLNEVIWLVKWANHPLLVKWPSRGKKLTQSTSLSFDAGLQSFCYNKRSKQNILQFRSNYPAYLCRQWKNIEENGYMKNFVGGKNKHKNNQIQLAQLCVPR